MFQEDAKLDGDGLSIELLPYIGNAAGRYADLVEARGAVSSLDDILSGTPVFAGTRIPVHDVAASAAAGFRNESILEAYPTLDAGKIRLATIYASAYPLRERPSPSTLRPAGSVTTTDKRIPRLKVGVENYRRLL